MHFIGLNLMINLRLDYIANLFLLSSLYLFCIVNNNVDKDNYEFLERYTKIKLIYRKTLYA